jgi:colicin import membrane protein
MARKFDLPAWAVAQGAEGATHIAVAEVKRRRNAAADAAEQAELDAALEARARGRSTGRQRRILAAYDKRVALEAENARIEAAAAEAAREAEAEAEAVRERAKVEYEAAKARVLA